jgi:hypothetical protein
MAILASDKGGGKDFEPIPAGMYVARCYQMIHIGTVETVYEGIKKDQNQVIIGWEFPNDTKVFKEEKGPQPLVISKTYTLSLYETSGLRILLESWRGQSFTEDEAKSFDITKVLGAPCLINVKHVKGQGKNSGKTYAQIASVSPLMKGTTCPPAVNPKVEFSVNEFDKDKFASFPEWLQDKIKSSKEYKEMVAASHVEQEPSHDQSERFVSEDDLPF